MLLRQARIRESSVLIENIGLNIAFQINHALAQGQLRPPSPGLETTHAPHHSLIIGWESPGSSFPIG
jgi:hypothetical protein